MVVLVLAVCSPGALAQVSTRSAQSDCQREAARNGYQVIRTGDFRQMSDGWQLELTLRSPQGRTDDGICTVRTSTGQVSFSGFDFGGAGGGAGMRFDCQSEDYKYRECQLPVDGRARMVRQYSRPTAAGGTCQEGQSWGQRGDRVWVDRGCRAQFEVERGAGGGGPGSGYFDCRSTDGRYQECRIQGGKDAQLVRAYNNSCRRDSTWGVRPGLVWVTAGCQAQFRAVGGGGGGPSDMPQRVEASCRAEAQRQFITVQNVTPARSHGTYWQATVHGKLRGHPVAADCRYDPKNNRSSLFLDQGGGAGGGSNELKVRAETACMAHAKRVGYQVFGQNAAAFVQNGLTVGLQLKRGNALSQASCFYETRTGQTRLDEVSPQPR
jgi:hypothetical protein